MDDVLIVEMRREDWDAVCRIYEAGLATGNASFEVDSPSWQVWDECHHSHSRFVARSGDEVVGWAALSPMSHRACYAGVAEVSVYVDARWRGRGVGKRLLDALIASSERQGIWSLYCSTFPENDASIRLQLSCGFCMVGRRESIAQHHGVWRDTVITERRSKLVGVE